MEDTKNIKRLLLLGLSGLAIIYLAIGVFFYFSTLSSQQHICTLPSDYQELTKDRPNKISATFDQAECERNKPKFNLLEFGFMTVFWLPLFIGTPDTHSSTYPIFSVVVGNNLYLNL